MKQVYWRYCGIVIVVLWGWIATGCTFVEPSATPVDDVMLDVADGSVRIANIRAGATPPNAPNGAVYLTIHNESDSPMRLLGGETDRATAVELHETVNDNGVMRMIPQRDGFEIAAGASLMLEPGGKHLMLADLTEPLVAGSEFTLTLHLADGTPLTVPVPVLTIGELAGERSEMNHGGETATDEP